MTVVVGGWFFWLTTVVIGGRFLNRPYEGIWAHLPHILLGAVVDDTDAHFVAGQVEFFDAGLL